MHKSAIFILHFLHLVHAFTFVHNGISRRHRSSSSIAFQTPQCPEPLAGFTPPHFSRATTFTTLFETKDGKYVEAEDLPAIQELFNKFCDKDGLMTKEALIKMTPFSEMLADEDLMMEELEDIWEAAPKFPDVSGEDTRIDVDSFVQIYRDVDDLFEDEGEEESAPEVKSTAQSVGVDTQDTAVDDPEDESVEAELERVYDSLCDKSGLVSKPTLQSWDEIQKLIEEGLLGEDEFDELWSKTPKSPGSSDQLDVDGFLSFNVALDSLFELDDDDDEEEPTDSTPPKNLAARQMVDGDDLPPGVLFAAIADEGYMVGMDELKLWSELQGMLNDGDLLQSELKDMFGRLAKSDSGKLDEEGFIALYEEIDSMFEEIGEDDEVEESSADAPPGDNQVKGDLLQFIDIIVEEDALPCGLECTEKDQKQVLDIINVLEKQPSNMIRARQGQIEMADLTGTWDLIYSSSNAMKFNQGLSGLGGSVPNGKFAGVKQKLMATKFMSDVEYIERIEVTPSTASFDVQVTGNWELRTSVSLFTGLPTIILNIEPGYVNYGPTSTRADHWKSLGPLNMLDMTYLDEDLRVMRGCTSADTVFIFKKSS